MVLVFSQNHPGIVFIQWCIKFLLLKTVSRLCLVQENLIFFLFKYIFDKPGGLIYLKEEEKNEVIVAW